MQERAQAPLHFYVAGVSTQLPMVQNRTVKIIAVTNKVRALGLSDLVTADEAGFPELRYEAFLAFFEPRSMPAALRDRISADVRTIGADAELSERFNAIGMKLRVTTPAELGGIVSDGRRCASRFDRERGAAGRQRHRDRALCGGFAGQADGVCARDRA